MLCFNYKFKNLKVKIIFITVKIPFYFKVKYWCKQCNGVKTRYLKGLSINQVFLRFKESLDFMIKIMLKEVHLKLFCWGGNVVVLILRFLYLYSYD